MGIFHGNDTYMHHVYCAVIKKSASQAKIMTDLEILF